MRRTEPVCTGVDVQNSSSFCATHGNDRDESTDGENMTDQRELD